MEQNGIKIVTEEWEKKDLEQQIRLLWRECFGDPLYYENFYFSRVYTGNRVYTFSNKGMIHLNPYCCNVKGKEYTLPYIVGVATDEKYRRQGVMRRLLQKVLSDLYEERIPFAYLMPANESYYKPFDFVPVTEKKEYEIVTASIPSVENTCYMTYSEVQHLSVNEQNKLFFIINSWLQNRYDVNTVHDKAYFDLLYEEKRCQNGDVIFCFEKHKNVEFFCGMFAYAINDKKACIEQIIMSSEKNKAVFVSQYFKQYTVVKVTEMYPYMMRIVNLESFFELFFDQVMVLLHDKTVLQVIDNILDGNNVKYRIENGKISVCTDSDLPEDECVVLTIAQLLDGVMKNRDGIYFAEIV